MVNTIIRMVNIMVKMVNVIKIVDILIKMVNVIKIVDIMIMTVLGPQFKQGQFGQHYY